MFEQPVLSEELAMVRSDGDQRVLEESQLGEVLQQDLDRAVGPADRVVVDVGVAGVFDNARPVDEKLYEAAHGREDEARLFELALRGQLPQGAISSMASPRCAVRRREQRLRSRTEQDRQH